MPYVQVWVEPERCDGTCAACRERDHLLARMWEAERHLRAGYPDAALHALTDDASLPFKKPADIANSYQLWRAGKLPGFAQPAMLEGQP